MLIEIDFKGYAFGAKYVSVAMAFEMVLAKCHGLNILNICDLLWFGRIPGWVINVL